MTPHDLDDPPTTEETAVLVLGYLLARTPNGRSAAERRARGAVTASCVALLDGTDPLAAIAEHYADPGYLGALLDADQGA
jgi:hypothetical protein